MVDFETLLKIGTFHIKIIHTTFISCYKLLYALTQFNYAYCSEKQDSKAKILFHHFSISHYDCYIALILSLKMNLNIPLHFTIISDYTDCLLPQ